MCKTNEQRLCEKLEQVRRQGVYLYLEGRPSTPEEIAGKCIKEDADYMADYVLSEEGVLKELRYDRVADWK